MAHQEDQPAAVINVETEDLPEESNQQIYDPAPAPPAPAQYYSTLLKTFSDEVEARRARKIARARAMDANATMASTSNNLQVIINPSKIITVYSSPYSPSQQSWKQTSALPYAIPKFVMNLLTDGKIPIQRKLMENGELIIYEDEPARQNCTRTAQRQPTNQTVQMSDLEMTASEPLQQLPHPFRVPQRRPPTSTNASIPAKRFYSSSSQSRQANSPDMTLTKMKMQIFEPQGWLDDVSFFNPAQFMEATLEEIDARLENYCNICNLVFESPSYLSSHNSRIHRAERSERPFRCKYCRNSYSRSSLLKKHMLSKHGDPKNTKRSTQISIADIANGLATLEAQAATQAIQSLMNSESNVGAYYQCPLSLTGLNLNEPIAGPSKNILIPNASVIHERHEWPTFTYGSIETETMAEPTAAATRIAVPIPPPIQTTVFPVFENISDADESTNSNTESTAPNRLVFPNIPTNILPIDKNTISDAEESKNSNAESTAHKQLDIPIIPTNILPVYENISGTDESDDEDPMDEVTTGMTRGSTALTPEEIIAALEADDEDENQQGLELNEEIVEQDGEFDFEHFPELPMQFLMVSPSKLIK